MKQCTGLLAALPSLLVQPSANTYLTTLVIPDRALIRSAVDRAFGASGRMKNMTAAADSADPASAFHFRPFEVLGTSRQFEWEREESAAPSNICAVHVATAAMQIPSPILSSSRRTFILINGVLQGRKIFDELGACCLSRRTMWQHVIWLTGGGVDPSQSLMLPRVGCTYEQMKEYDLLRQREAAKQRARRLALQGWQRNTGDEQWSLRRADSA
jgi:tRNA-specific adenosine deaminase 1